MMRQKINQLIHNNILAHGTGLIEAGMAWWHSDHTLNAFTRYTGFQHYQEAQNQGRGVILLSGHFTTLELGARLLAMKIPNIHLIYKEQRNQTISQLINQRRQRYLKTFQTHQILPIRNALKRQQTILITPDQDLGTRHSIFVPFFGIPTSTVTSISFLSKLYQTPIVPVFCVKHDTAPYYHIYFLPAMGPFTGKDLTHETTQVNACIETAIRKQISGYLWSHRRFKTRPDTEQTDFY